MVGIVGTQTHRRQSPQQRAQDAPPAEVEWRNGQDKHVAGGNPEAHEELEHERVHSSGLEVPVLGEGPPINAPRAISQARVASHAL